MTEAHDLVLFIARLLLATMFVASAVDKFRLNPVEMRQIASLHLPAPATLERLTGLFEIAGAAALIFGLYARLAAAALALFVVFVSLFFVKFWSFDGPSDVRAMMRNIFLGNAAATGGLIYVAVFGPGGLAFMNG